MKMSLTTLLVFGFVFAQSQTLSRLSGNRLMVELPSSEKIVLDCNTQKNIEIDLLQKTMKEDALTCSKQYSWEIVSSVKSNDGVKHIFDRQEKGIFMAQLRVPFNCNEKRKFKTSEIIQEFRTNILNETSENNNRVTSERAMNNITIYPNPTIDNIYVDIIDTDTESKIPYTLYIRNFLGQIMLEDQRPSTQRKAIEIDLKRFPAGQYTLSFYKGIQQIGLEKITKVSL